MVHAAQSTNKDFVKEVWNVVQMRNIHSEKLEFGHSWKVWLIYIKIRTKIRRTSAMSINGCVNIGFSCQYRNQHYPELGNRDCKKGRHECCKTVLQFTECLNMNKRNRVDKLILILSSLDCQYHASEGNSRFFYLLYEAILRYFCLWTFLCPSLLL